VELVLNALQKRFSVGGDSFIALDGISLEVPHGQFVTVMGSNGAGKSTLLNCIAGSVRADSGRILLGGRDLTRLSEPRRARWIGRAFQDPRIGTAPQLTVAENIALANCRARHRTLRRAVRGQLRDEIRARFEESGIHDLDDRLDQSVGTLSGGQRQAISLLMATWTEPSLLLLDEHTAALDPNRAASIMEMTERIQKAHNLTVLMVTHDVSQAIGYGDRLLMMDRGRVVEDIEGAPKRSLTFEKVIDLFQEHRVQVGDRTLLATDTGPAGPASATGERIQT
jgi:putative ABC transport system ATP-binding protein